MKQAVIVDAARTPIGKASADAGYFRDVRADELSAQLLQAIVQRSGIDPHLIEDVRWGCVQQQGEQGYDIARIAVLMAELPVEVAGVTINRNCGSSQRAPVSWSRPSSTLPTEAGSAPVPEQPRGPGQNFHSAPAW